MPTAINTMPTPTIKHMAVAAIRRHIAILTRGQLTVCALVHKAIGLVHSGTAQFEAGAYA